MLNRTVATAMALLLSGGALAVVQAVPAHALLTCDGEIVSMVGTATDDILTGTPYKDVILAGAGNDRIDGRGGDDVICGEDGRDTIHGGDGEDRVWGDRGSDHLFGDDGNDTVGGGTDGCSVPACNSGDVDRIDGGAGDDKLFAAHYGRGILRGEDDADLLYGGTLNDQLLGGAGQDYLERRRWERHAGRSQRVRDARNPRVLLGLAGRRRRQRQAVRRGRGRRRLGVGRIAAGRPRAGYRHLLGGRDRRGPQGRRQPAAKSVNEVTP